MKKQRSASPSHAMPRSAFFSTTSRMMNSRFSGRRGLGSWSGKLPSGFQYVVIRSSPSFSSSGPTIGPAMPLPPSQTTRSGLMALASITPSACSWKSSKISTSSVLPPPGGSGSPSSIFAFTSPIPASPERASAPRPTSLAPVYFFGLCEAVHISPPSSPREPTR